MLAPGVTPGVTLRVAPRFRPSRIGIRAEPAKEKP